MHHGLVAYICYNGLNYRFFSVLDYEIWGLSELRVHLLPVEWEVIM